MDSVRDFSATMDTGNQNHNIFWNYNIPYQNCSAHENLSNYGANLNTEPVIIEGLEEQAHGDSSNTSAFALSNCNLDEISFINFIDDIIPNYEDIDNGLEYSCGQNDMGSVETPTHVPSSIKEIRLSPERSKEETPKKAVEKSDNKINLIRSRKVMSASSAQEDQILDEFISKRVYRRTLMRPKKNGAPVPAAGGHKKEQMEKTRGNIGSSSTGNSSSEDDVLDLSKFTKRIPLVNPEDKTTSCCIERDTRKIVILSNILIVPPSSVKSLTSEVEKYDQTVEGDNTLKTARPILELPLPNWGYSIRQTWFKEDIISKNRGVKRSRSTMERDEGEARKNKEKKLKKSDRSGPSRSSDNKDRESRTKGRNGKRTSRSSDVVEPYCSPISPTSLREYIEPSPAQNQLGGGNPTSSQHPMEIYYSPISPARPLEKTEQYTIPNPYLHQFGSGYLKRDAKEDYSWIDKFEQLVPEEYLLFPSSESKPKFSPRRPAI